MDHRPSLAETSRDGLALLRAAGRRDPCAVFEVLDAMTADEVHRIALFLIGGTMAALRRVAVLEGRSVDDLIDEALRKIRG